ncbi:putative tail chaperone protein [Streptomyces phage SV1]|nr:putative tail chaperone protein [Streptomyces phage SV1]AFU62155.1 putative tail chaperone protein [Streptomyces phage SV1]
MAAHTAPRHRPRRNRGAHRQPRRLNHTPGRGRMTPDGR